MSWQQVYALEAQAKQMRQDLLAASPCAEGWSRHDPWVNVSADDCVYTGWWVQAALAGLCYGLQERPERPMKLPEENYPAVAGRGLQGRAQPGRASAMEAEGGSQGMGCQGRRSGHSYAGQFQQTCHASYPSGSLFLRKPHCSNQRLNLLRYSLSHLGKKVNGIVGRDLARGRC